MSVGLSVDVGDARDLGLVRVAPGGVAGVVDEEGGLGTVELGELELDLVLDVDPARSVGGDGDLQGEGAGLAGVLDPLQQLPERIGELGVGRALAELDEDILEGSDDGLSTTSPVLGFTYLRSDGIVVMLLPGFGLG